MTRIIMFAANLFLRAFSKSGKISSENSEKILRTLETFSRELEDKLEDWNIPNSQNNTNSQDSPNNPNSQNNPTEEIMSVIIENDINQLNSILARGEIKINDTFNVEMNGSTIKKTPLELASMCGNYEIVKILMRNGANVNTKSYDDMTPIISASIVGNLEIVRLLYERGANINAKENTEKNALMCASQSGHFEVVKYLVERGANVNYKNSKGITALMWASSFENLEVAKYLIEKGADIHLRDDRGNTALDYAKNTRTKEELIKAGTRE